MRNPHDNGCNAARYGSTKRKGAGRGTRPRAVRTAGFAGVGHWRIVLTALDEARAVGQRSGERCGISKDRPLPGKREKQNPNDQPPMH